MEFRNFKKAWREGKKGNFYGILSFRKNSTQKFLRRFEKDLKVEEDFYAVDFYPDNTDLNMAQFIINEIEETSKDFLEKFLEKNCSLTFKLKSIFPMKFEKPIFKYTKKNYLGDIVYSIFYG